MDVPTPSYITAAEVKANSLVAGLIALSNSDIEKLVTIAEDQIDAYVGPQRHHPDDDNENRVFPREEDIDEDGNSVIPYRVSVACLRQVEWLYTQWWNSRTSSLLPVVEEVSQEDIRGDGGYSAVYNRGGGGDSKVSLCLQAQELLKGFVSRVTAIGVSDPDSIPSPT
jgi:hypothetical protein